MTSGVSRLRVFFVRFCNLRQGTRQFPRYWGHRSIWFYELIHWWTMLHKLGQGSPSSYVLRASLYSRLSRPMHANVFNWTRLLLRCCLGVEPSVLLTFRHRAVAYTRFPCSALELTRALKASVKIALQLRAQPFQIPFFIWRLVI